MVRNNSDNFRLLSLIVPEIILFTLPQNSMCERKPWKWIARHFCIFIFDISVKNFRSLYEYPYLCHKNFKQITAGRAEVVVKVWSFELEWTLPDWDLKLPGEIFYNIATDVKSCNSASKFHKNLPGGFCVLLLTNKYNWLNLPLYLQIFHLKVAYLIIDKSDKEFYLKVFDLLKFFKWMTMRRKHETLTLLHFKVL